MTPPIRPIIHSLTALPRETKDMTMREAVEWYKGFATSEIGVPNELERGYIDGVFLSIASGIGEREGVPTGFLSYMLSELAQTELRLRHAVLEESQEGLLQ